MSIKIKKLTLRNFLSIGNVTQTLNFNREELVLILGENLDMGGEDAGSRNGCGKSALINGLSYGLYGWPISDIKKENLINKTNGKNMLATVEFEANAKEYKIVRGLKPRILEFYENGIKKSEDEKNQDDLAQGDSKETQKEIEKILGMSHDMFCQIVVVNTYTTPFLFQKIADQRMIIEQLLGITLLSEKAEKLKDEIKSVKEQVMQESFRIKAVETSNKKIQDQIDSMLRKQTDWLLKKENDLKELESSIEFLSTIDIENELKNHSKWDEYNAVNLQRVNLSQQKKQSETNLSREQKALAKMNSDLTSLENQCCHTCHQKIQNDVHEELLNKIRGEHEQLSNDIEKTKNTLSTLNMDLLQLKHTIIKIN
jgi:DNA repair exonuclease SbcCD ATPase subunit